MKPLTLGILTTQKMSANPGSLVPVYMAILQAYEYYNAQDHERPVKTYCFSILPQPSTHRRFIALVPENVKAMTGYQGAPVVTEGPSFLKSYQTFYDVFQFRKFGIMR
jgi:hypothetical protein